MLTPDYLENVPAAMMKLWQQVEDDILRDVARRIGKMGEVTETADWQLWRREQVRLVNREVLKILARYSGKSEAELRRIFQEAAAKALEDDDRLYTSAGLDPPAPNEDPALLNLLNAGYEQTAGTWQNLTATTAATVSGQFEATLDRAWLQVASGAFDYKTAVRRAVNGLAAHMAGVTYPTGHRDTLEVAVDNQCFTVGVSPARDEAGPYVAYGNSIAVDPWGTVLCRAGGEETVLYADLDMARLEAVRKQLPILSARRTDLYEVRER